MQGNSENKVAFPLLILLMKARQWVAVNTEAADVKFLVEWTDKANEVSLQYLEFLSNTMSKEGYRRLLPSLTGLVNDYGLTPAEGFQVYRPLLRAMESVEPEDGEIDEGSNGMEGVEATAPVSSGPGLTFSELTRSVESFDSLKGTNLWGSLSPEFYSAFWSLSLYDLLYPKEKYDSEISRLQVVVLKELVTGAV